MRILSLLFLLILSLSTMSQKTQKPPLHARNWMAITGKPLSANAGAMIFNQGGNAIDAACAMLAAGCTMWDVLSWGGETQAIIYNPKTKKVISINALGVAPTGATADFFKSKGYDYPPEYGPLAAVTPGTPGGLCFMLAEYGTMSLKQVLAPAMQMADGYPMEDETARSIERNKERIKQWPYSKAVLLPHEGQSYEAPEAGEIFRQADLLQTLQKMVDAEQEALKKGKSRKEAIYAAYDRFYKGDIAKEFVRGCQEQGGLITMEDLAKWKPMQEEPLKTNYKGIDVYKLQQWSQGPALLQALNILENFDLKSMGYNSTRYIHTIYQTMSLAFADRDFYYGDPYFSPDEPIQGLLSKDYAKERAKLINWNKNDSKIGPGDPYPYEGKTNPYKDVMKQRGFVAYNNAPIDENYLDALHRGTTSIEAADKDGWVVSVTPSGGWVPACIAGHTGVGMSQRMQSFVLDPSIDPFNVVEPGKRPRVTLTPSLAMKEGKPFLAFAVQGGDTQDQNLLQFFLNVVEFGMTVQEAVEAPNINTDQLWLSLGGTKADDRKPKPGNILLDVNTPDFTRKELKAMGYKLTFGERTSGPINAMYFDWKHGTIWGGSSNNGEDYGIGW
ncbi:MAG TPA: gamma-glutamyltransferase family protein [Chitinophagaceae bacterium]|nr:gamma-glutamyltransferase family protein [Chitinophagaceae bacterium]